MKKKLCYIFFVFFLGVFYSCDKNDIIEDNEKSLLKDAENLINEFDSQVKGIFDFSDAEKEGVTSNSRKEEWFANESVMKFVSDSLKSQEHSIGSKTIVSLRSTSFLDRKVGVFKVSTCGNYPEIIYSMDCEDNNGATYITGNVGATYVDNNKNVVFHFCVVGLNNYGGGALNLTTKGSSIAYNFDDFLPYTSGRFFDPRYEIRIRRYHDNEDSKTNNHFLKEQYSVNKTVSNDGSFFGSNTVLEWVFPQSTQASLPFSYGVIANNATSNMIYIDDEDSSNTNFAEYMFLRIESGGNRNFNSSLMANQDMVYGIRHSTNTNYYIQIF